MSYFRSNDPDRDFDRWDKAQQAWEDSLPHCDICGEPIDASYRKSSFYNIPRCAFNIGNDSGVFLADKII